MIGDHDPEDWGSPRGIGFSVPLNTVPLLTRALKFFQQKCFVIEAHEHKQIDNLLAILECYNEDS